jgi:hypothetical protein
MLEPRAIGSPEGFLQEHSVGRSTSWPENVSRRFRSPNVTCMIAGKKNENSPPNPRRQWPVAEAEGGAGGTRRWWESRRLTGLWINGTVMTRGGGGGQE